MQQEEGKDVVIRAAEVADAEAILAFATELFTKTDSVLTVAEEFNITLEEERGFIHAHASTQTALLLVAVDGDKVVGLLNFNCHPKVKMRHTGELGVSVHADYRGKGIGKKMMETLISWATGVPEIEKLVLHVMADNTPAVKLYENLGFVTEGREIKAIKQPNGVYVDLLAMGLFLAR